MSGERKFVEGALYRATVRGRVGVMCIRRRDGWAYDYVDGVGASYTSDCRVTNIVGPLRVLGPDERAVEPGQVVLDLDVIRSEFKSTHRPGADLLDYLRDDGYGPIADAIANQTPPPRIPEPGLWGVVEACTRVDSAGSTRYYVRSTRGWEEATGSRVWQWDDLIDPVLVREGVES